ncbi:peptidyl-tRNA hydrolase II [Ceraceosorus guamensis]|uniref:peptidyl-tRNA hydrolase n=1 Tax=Ceraceosorus guamensis TaxID=1522189 RepID=A0A316VTE1_9BASI|nr:peptidyl-tRNA hydrolase II [Ceraceosorus guamensis]PWN40856.1 peptidyl-tRNA hydrolase II [Ceraceosorus guamensis]
MSSASLSRLLRQDITSAPGLVSLLLALGLGYYLGTKASSGSSFRQLGPRIIRGKGAQDQDDSDEDSDDEDLGEVIDEKDWVNMQSLRAKLMEECKLVLIVRTDLKMDKGKIAAQCGHATLACYKTMMAANPDIVRQWERIGQAKVALKCSSEEEMRRLEESAKALNLCARSIRDAGRTQVAAGSRTVLGIGPGPVKLIDQVTGHLKLL